MKILKGLVLSLLSLLLFLSLSTFGIVYALRSTLLDPNFVTAEVNKIDMSALTREMTDMLVASQLTGEYQFLKEPVYAAVADFTPSLKQQLNTGINSAYGYFLGKTQKLSLTISLDPLKNSLRDRSRQAFMQSLPSQLAGASQTQVDQYFNQMFQQYAQQIPSSFTVDENALGTQTMTQVRMVRDYIGYVQMSYWALIILMALLVAGIILIYRNVRSATRALGLDFLLYGAFEYAGILVAKYFAPSLPLSGLPRALESWLSEVLIDLMAPLELFSIIVIAIGVILIVVSFVYRPRPATQPATIVQ